MSLSQGNSRAAPSTGRGADAPHSRQETEAPRSAAARGNRCATATSCLPQSGVNGGTRMPRTSGSGLPRVVREGEQMRRPLGEGTDAPRSAAVRGTDMPRGPASAEGHRGQRKGTDAPRLASPPRDAVSRGTDAPLSRREERIRRDRLRQREQICRVLAQGFLLLPRAEQEGTDAPRLLLAYPRDGFSGGTDMPRTNVPPPPRRTSRNRYAARPEPPWPPPPQAQKGTNTPLLHPRRQRRHPVGLVRRLVPADAADAGEAEREA